MRAPSVLAASTALPQPKGDVILTFTGHQGLTNRLGTAEFDRDMLAALGLTSFTTKMPWYDRPVTLEGVLMTSLMAAVEAQGSVVTAQALNDYATEIPRVDFAQHGTLLAMKPTGPICRCVTKVRSSSSIPMARIRNSSRGASMAAPPGKSHA